MSAVAPAADMVSVPGFCTACIFAERWGGGRMASVRPQGATVTNVACLDVPLDMGTRCFTSLDLI